MSRQPLFPTLALSALLGAMGVVSPAFAATSTPGSAVYQARSSLVYPAGTRVTIVAIDSSDPLLALYPASTFVGKSGVVYEMSSTNKTLTSFDGGTWWGGPVLLDGDTSPAPFSKIQVTSTTTPTEVIDTTPLLFGFTAVSDAIPGVATTSGSIKVQGIEANADISITGGEYAIDGGAWTSASGTVGPNQTVAVRVTAPAGFGETAAATLTIGGVSGTFTVKTLTTPGDYSPDAFSLAGVTDVAPGTVVESPTTVTVTGITASTPISISGGEYSINGGAWTASRGTVALAGQVKVRLTAPSTYGTTGKATLTIGDVSADFSVGTRSFTPVTTVTQVFTNAGTSATVTDGIIQVLSTPTTPLQLSGTALTNAVVSIPPAVPVPVVFGTNTVDLVGQTSGTALQIVNIGGNPGLVTISGSTSLTAAGSGTVIPVVGGSGGYATVQTTTTNTSLVTGPSVTAGGGQVLAVSGGGSVLYNNVLTGRSSRASGALPTSFSVFPGEAVLADEAGAAAQVRLGSFAQDGSQAGDYIVNVPNAASTLNVPLVTGASQRFGNDWVALVGQAIAGQLGLGTYVSLTQDASSGVLTLTTGNGVYRFLPVGSLALAATALNGGSRAVSVGAIAANLTAILDNSLSFAVAPATAYADLKTALKSISSGATLEVLGDGVIKAGLLGTDYIAQPASAAVQGAVTAGVCPGFDTVGNQLALCDATGKRQVLYAAFADTDTLRSTFAAILPGLTVGNTGADGLYSTTFSGATYTLTPDFTLTTPPANQAGNLWWSDPATGKIYVRYPSGTAQGFGLR